MSALKAVAGFFVLAEDVSFSDSGQLSATRLVDSVSVGCLPATLRPCAFAGHLTLEGASEAVQVPFRIVARRPHDNDIVVFAEDTLHIPHPQAPARFRYSFDEIEFAQSGRYWLSLQLDVGAGWEEVTQWPLDVHIDAA